MNTQERYLRLELVLALGLAALVSGCGEPSGSSVPEPVLEEAPNVARATDEGIELNDGSFVRLPPGLPSTLWKGDGGQTVSAMTEGPYTTLSVNTSESLKRARKRYHRTLVQAGWKEQNRLDLRNTSESWYERDDGTVVCVFVWSTPERGTVVNVVITKPDSELPPPD